MEQNSNNEIGMPKFLTTSKNNRGRGYGIRVVEQKKQQQDFAARLETVPFGDYSRVSKMMVEVRGVEPLSEMEST